MKIFALSAILIGCAASRAYALHPPTDPDKINNLQSDINLVRAYTHGTNGHFGIEDFRRMLDNARKDGASHASITYYSDQLSLLEKKRAALCHRIIQEVITQYGIQPERSAGMIRRAATWGLDQRNLPVYEGTPHEDPAAWAPEFEDFRPVPSGDGSVVVKHSKVDARGLNDVREEPVTADNPIPTAITWSNGDIGIGSAAFEFSPGYLAAVIAHETVHFDQKTNPGHQHLTNMLAEVSAFHVMLDNRAIFGLRPDEVARIEAIRDTELDWTRNNPEPLNEVELGRLSRIVGSGSTASAPAVPAQPGDAEDPFFSNLTGSKVTQDAKDTFSEQARLARAAEEARRKEALLQRAADDRKALAEKLGFWEIYKPGTWDLIGFDDKEQYSHFRSQPGVVLNDEQIQVAMGLGRSCLDQMRGGPTYRGTGVASDILSQRWGDASFRSGLLAAYGSSYSQTKPDGTSGSGAECLAYVLQNLRPPVEMKDLVGKYVDYAKILKKRQEDYAKAQAKWRKEHPPAPPPKPRRPDGPVHYKCDADEYRGSDGDCYPRHPGGGGCATNPDTGVRGCPQ